jgi:hypothetical protein
LSCGKLRGGEGGAFDLFRSERRPGLLRFLLALEFKQIIDPNFSVLMVANLLREAVDIDIYSY